MTRWVGSRSGKAKINGPQKLENYAVFLTEKSRLEERNRFVSSVLPDNGEGGSKMGDALAEAQLQQAGNQLWSRLLATVVSAGYFTFIMQHLPSSWFDFMYTSAPVLRSRNDLLRF